ncbi:transposase [Vibrio sp. S4M6]|uniref:transposase n=1 Tax=Vibrio sinus TaxID=2946865 RepID=UPI00202A3D34|nr:transposase [Vibrio sinus]MCL9781749.1 transposase [Vibrio sinus]
MTTARSRLVCLESTAYYHCVSRCVRRSFLCGEDALTGRSYEHRRAWVEKKIHQLSAVYCIDVCAYAVMSNHYHIVMHVDKQGADKLTPYEVAKRWGQHHHLPLIVQRWLNGEAKSKAENQAVFTLMEQWRARLCNLSWFMKELNYEIACRANKEDDCKGHFWESRFKSQALLDEQALLAAMAYVDLNPVRAGVSKTPESSEHTSIQVRIRALKNNQPTVPGLAVFIGNPTNEIVKGLPFRLIDYLELVDWSARQYSEGKHVMLSKVPPILCRLNLSPTQWAIATTQIEKPRATFVGCKPNLIHLKQLNRRKRVHALSLDS